MQIECKCKKVFCVYVLIMILFPSDHQDYILEPLSLPESPGGISAEEESSSVPCLFCEEYYLISEQNQILKHMLIKHKLVISDVKLIADFRRYVSLKLGNGS